MIKKYSWLVVLPLALSLVIFGCGLDLDKIDYGTVGEELPDDPFDFAEIEGGLDMSLWGNTRPDWDDDLKVLSIAASGSTGFYISFEDIDYEYNADDILVVTYAAIVDTPTAVIVAKQVSGNDFIELEGGAAWGIGNGREFFLETTEKASFEVKMSHFANPNAREFIGFQHNQSAQLPLGNFIAQTRNIV